MMFERNLAYEASAGSGKTFMLVVRYLSLLYIGSDASKILALTFTNKAANEMQDRIITTLEELPGKEAELATIAKLCDMSQDELLKRRTQVLKHFLQSSTKIMTIDSFFAKILRKFSLYVSLMPDFTTVSAQHETKLLRRFLQEVDIKNDTKKLIDLSLESKKRIFDLFFMLDDFYVKSKELASFTFTYKEQRPLELEAVAIVKEMEAIVKNCKGASSRALGGFAIENFEDILLKSWLGRESLDYSTFSKCFTPELDTLLYRLYDVLERYFDAREQNFFYALQRLATHYQSAKRELFKADNEVSFNDVTMLVYEILRERIDREFLYFRLDAQIEHILLDEFQDTSILQYEILHPLINEVLSGSGTKEGGSFFFVGDTKQSIYRFRGGVSALFYEVAKLNGTKIEPLSTNYRSQKHIVEFVNDIFRDKMADKMARYVDQKVLEERDGGYVEVKTTEDILEEIDVNIKRLLDAGAKENDIAILCATNGDGELIKEYLQSKGREVVTETTVKLIHQRSIKTLLEYLKYLYFKEEIFKENFFALIGKRVEISFVDFANESLLGIVKRAIERYGLFEGDFNIYRFLEIISAYGDIEELLFNYERIETEAIGNANEGIRVLTIHKSKGLEYPHVIVVDRLGSPPVDRSAIIYDYEGIELKNIYLRIRGRDKIDTRYAEAIERNKELVRQDNLNALYVAFTRARQNLFVLQKEKKSSFSILGLQEEVRGVLQTKPEEGNQKNEHSREFTFNELYYGSQSNLLEQNKTQEQEDVAAQNFGVAMHYMLEMMERFDEEGINDARQALLNRFRTVLEPKEIDEIVKRIEMLTVYEPFLRLLDGKIYKEKALKYKNKLYYIDLLIEHDGNYVVIDYKSSKNYHEEHCKQVRNYMQAVSRLSGNEAQGYLCYLLGEGIEMIKV